MSRDHSQNHYGPNASFDGYDSDLASAGILIELLRQRLAGANARIKLMGETALNQQKREVMLRNYLERLACLGNGDMHGNSIGNCIAQEALAATEQQSPLDNPVKR